MLRTHRSRRRLGVALAAVALTASGTGGLAALTTTTAPAAGDAARADWARCLTGSTDRQAVFARAAEVSGVPEQVLLGVSYLETRWDDHHGEMSTAGGYGPMHLTLRDLGKASGDGAAAKGEGGSAVEGSTGTLLAAADALGVPVEQLRTDPVANVCGGAAVLASYQPTTASGAPRAWTTAVARYADAGREAEATTFVRQVFTTIRTGAERTTDDGQHVTLAATPDATADTAAVQAMGLPAPDDDVSDCPASLDCLSVPAPYEQYGSSPSAYGNHDLADRPHDLAIKYIVIHDTEASWDTSLKLVQDPTYLAWNYTVRSSDGQVAQHLNAKNVGWHAGNWYVNTHSIGVEHEGYAASGATWYTERMYQNSATLVGHLAHEYGVPLDRAHIIGHDQVPGVDAAHVKGMHWDPGPYWDWQHYMSLLGAPLVADRRSGPSDVVTVVPGFADNPEPVTGCTTAGTACPTQGTNVVYLHTAPSEDAPLVSDAGLHTDGSASTTGVSDIGARLAAGQKVVVALRQGEWVATWYLGRLGWFHNRNAAGDAVIRPSQGDVVTPAGATAVPVYGRAYPEASAYPAEIPAQPVSPLQYTLAPGQSYVLADTGVPTDFYYAKTYDDSLAGDHTVVSGKERYLQIWFGHRIAYVKAADVAVHPG